MLTQRMFSIGLPARCLSTDLSAKIQVTISLSKDMNTENILYRIRKNWVIQFHPDETLAGHEVRFFTNYPHTQKDHFVRSKYREVTMELANPTLSKGDLSDRYFEIQTHQSGNFQFYTLLDDSKDINGQGYFLVDPRFTKRNDRTYELDSVMIQTYMPKCLGDFSTWKEKLEVCRNTNYNMIHFTPLQELGSSGSAYCILDQLRLNPQFHCDWAQVADLVNFMEREWGILSMADLVFNHTAENSPWIHEHPECAYNMLNSPHLRPAYLLDRIMWNMTLKVLNRQFEPQGLSNILTEEWQLDIIRSTVWNDIHNSRLVEYFLCHVDNTIREFEEFVWKNRLKIRQEWNEAPTAVTELDTSKCERLGATINMRQAAVTFYRANNYNMTIAKDRLHALLHHMNQHQMNKFYSNMENAVNNFIANARYRFVEPGGLRLYHVRRDDPLMWNYFYHPGSDQDTPFEECERMMFEEDTAQQIMAFNGWLMRDDPLRNFAEDGSEAYLRRDIVIWGDCIKLRYGSCEKDCPYLWNRMREYAERAAITFHAVRLDNCHGTPSHVSQWLLDNARAVRNDLYIVAELFTGSVDLDNIFLNRLGINSLIREALVVNTASEFCAYVDRYGGSPVGSFIQASVRPMVPSSAHAIFFDGTHDNPSPVQRHCAINVLPMSAITAMAHCAIGSNRGYDEFVPHYIDVVKEQREYRAWGDESDESEKTINMSCGILQAKAAFNELHDELAKENYMEVFVDQIDHDIVSVTRHSPFSRKSVILFAHTAIRLPNSMEHRPVRAVDVPGTVTRILIECSMRLNDGVNLNQIVADFKFDGTVINGLSEKLIGVNVRQGGFSPKKSEMLTVEDLHDEKEGKQRLHFHYFPPGSVIIIRVDLGGKAKQALRDMHRAMQVELQHCVQSASTGPIRVLLEDIENDIDTECIISSQPGQRSLAELLRDLTLVDLNYVLFRNEAEERPEHPEFNAYTVPGFDTFVYNGLYSIVYRFDKIRHFNDLGHPLCTHIRQGDWMMEYIVKRFHMHRKESIQKLGDKFSKFVWFLSALPSYLKPCYVDVFVAGVFSMAQREMVLRMAPELEGSSLLRQRLCANSVIFCGDVVDSVLPPLHTSVVESLPLWMKSDQNECNHCPTIAAGFPHFASGLFRAWGRDTFISFRGLLLLTGRFEEARCLLLSYSSLLRHGLMPNLLGNYDPNERSISPRYNCRDAVWWWLYCIREFCILSKDQEGKLLKEKVLRLFPRDFERSWYEQNKYFPEKMQHPTNFTGEVVTLCDLVMEALERHFEGIDFIEWGAPGDHIDRDMSEKGFHVTAGIMPVSKDSMAGIPCGGSSYNCGTWMDKMGSSVKAGNKGVPATPRDGAAVELAGLCASVVEWLHHLHESRHLEAVGVRLRSQEDPGKDEELEWSVWLKLLRQDFERLFWIPKDIAHYNAGIYKDTVGSSGKFTDEQFRPNFLVAMAVAPDLFDTEHAWFALKRVRHELLGPLGMRSLAKNDWQYRNSYLNSDDSEDFSVAHGFSYHQGPEWLWPVGYYLRAYLIFGTRLAKMKRDRRIHDDACWHVRSVIARMSNVMINSPWNSLPELTNADGAFCSDSCPAQAWSVACLHEALYELMYSEYTTEPAEWIRAR